jgi:hypothetical protein
MALTYLGGFYAIGEHVSMGGDSRPKPKRWVTGGSARLREGCSIEIHYVGDTLVRVDSVHAWGFALISAVQIGMCWQWPPSLVQRMPPSLFIEPAIILEPSCLLRVTLTMADLNAEELPRICDLEVSPLELEPHFDTGDNDNG